MPDLTLLSDLGRASLHALWVPVALWTVVAGAAEVLLRWRRPPAALGLPVRGAVLCALPLALSVPPLLAWLRPAGVVPPLPTDLAVWLPAVVVGGAPLAGPPAIDAAPPLGLAAVGLLTGAAAVVAVAHLARLALAVVAVGRTRRSLPSAHAEAASAVHAARQRLGVRRRIDAVQAPPSAPPFTVGWRRPVVALPAALDGEARDLAALHEVAHVQRADAAWHLAQRALTAVFAIHPLVWTIARGLELDRERAADASVLAARPDQRRAYADLLFAYAARPTPPLALGTTRGASSLKTRIDAMTRPLSPSAARRMSRIGRGTGLSALVVALGLVALAAAPAVLSPAPVTGLVIDADTRAPLSGASVQVMGTTVGATTGRDGRYRLDAPARDHVLRVSATGYEPRTVALADGQETLDVALTTANVSDPGGADGRRAMRDPAPPGVFEVVEEMPRLIGGLDGLQQRVIYPPSARADSTHGHVVVRFVVTEEGTVEDATVLRSPDDRLSEAALAAVRASRFEPGRQRGEAVKVRFAVPIRFQLDADE